MADERPTNWIERFDRHDLFSRDGKEFIGAVETVRQNKTNLRDPRPDGFWIGRRAFVWSSKFQQYREANLVDLADPLLVKISEELTKKPS